jgi:DNA processing protein
MTDLKYWVGFRLIQGVGRARFSQLLSYFGRMENAWHASPAELRLAGLDGKTVNSIVGRRPNISLDAEMEKIEKCKVRVLTWNMAEFPAKLKEIYDVPPVLYIKGELLPEDELAVAVVGTRRVTRYGQQVTEQLAKNLAQSKITVVSGLAWGVDSIAHQAALEAGGRTIAVLGCGLDMVYPSRNAKLAHQIVEEQGALVSDYPLGTKPKAENFPPRNRIISGLSLGVLVIEAGERSGALITARLALEQNRDVFAVPGSILSPMSRGTNRLIQDGAKLVQDVQDILQELNLAAIPLQLEMRETIPSNETESQILKCLSQEQIHIDEICRTTQIPITVVSSTLAMMELKGMVQQTGGMNYVLGR